MIYLSDRKVLFLKPKKVAGTSVEIALSTACTGAPGDIVTPITPMDEVTRLRQGGALPMNWAANAEDDRELRDRLNQIAAALKADGDRIEKPTRRLIALTRRWLRTIDARFRAHASPALAAEGLGRAVFDAALKVTIVREPLDQLLSRVYFKLKNEESFEIGDEAWTQQVEESLVRSNRGFYLRGSRRICDVYLRYEHLADDLADLDRRLGTAIAERLPWTKHGNRADRRPAQELLTRDQIARCVKTNRGIYREFGYAPPAGFD